MLFVTRIKGSNQGVRKLDILGDVEDILAARGIGVFHEPTRQQER